MTAALFVRAVSVLDRILGGDPLEPAPTPVEPDVEGLAIPSEVEESRPEDLDDCSRCEGFGMYVSYEGDDGRLAGYRTCSWCCGTGQRGAA